MTSRMWRVCVHLSYLYSLQLSPHETTEPKATDEVDLVDCVTNIPTENEQVQGEPF